MSFHSSNTDRRTVQTAVFARRMRDGTIRLTAVFTKVVISIRQAIWCGNLHVCDEGAHEDFDDDDGQEANDRCSTFDQ